MAAKRQSTREFINYLKNTIVPDSEEAGFTSYAADLKRAAELLENLLPDAASARAARALMRSKLDDEGDFDIENDDLYDMACDLKRILKVG